MNIESATFDVLAEPPVPEWIVRVSATGGGFEIRAIPIVGRVGIVPLEGLLPLDDGTGIVGYLRQVPVDGDHLFIGFADHELIDTGIAFQAPPNA
jgi:hypothetical protein